MNCQNNYKKCSACNLVLELKCFPVYKKYSPPKPRGKCYKCLAIDNKKSRQKNLKKYAYKAKLRRHARKIRAIEYLGGVCFKCKGTFHPSVFDFHHINPEEKERDPGLMMGLTDENLFKELDKCQLLCANCHRIFHFENGY